MLPNSYASRIALAENKPTVITAHGALEPWALLNSGWKKKIVRRWFQFQDLKTASCIHVNSHNEMRGIRQLGLTQPVAVIPNGIHFPDFQDLPPKVEFTEAFPETKGKRLILFLGRIHPKKGTDLLVRAWGQLASRFPDAHLVIAGPDVGLLEECKAIVHKFNIADRVTFTGNLQGRQKLQALSAADYFVLPSHSEGFSLAVIEAMACRLPVLFTPGCNFPEATAAGAAVEVSPTMAGVADGLRHLLELTDDARAQMGNSGSRLIQDGYTWDVVAQRTLALYSWLCSGTDCPSFVCE
jgi:glycosyltransferase involved in cell wall biosynthesis